MAAEIQKIYDLKEIGGEHLIDTLEQINRQFASIKRTKQSLNKESIKASFDGDTEAVRKLQEQMNNLKLKEGELKVERQKVINQLKEMQLARQIELKQKKEEAAGNKAVEGSYYDLSRRYRELSNIAKNVIPLNDTLQVEEAQRELNALKVQLDAFNRGLSPDGTLVGEYKTGILNAFKDAGLTDLIQNQLTQAKTRVRDLDNQFDLLKQELSDVRVTGKGSLEVIERQMIENRKAAADLTNQIDRIGKEIKETGSLGDRLTQGLQDGFRGLRGELSSAIIQFIGFQAIFSKVQSEISEGFGDARRFAGIEEAFNRLNDPDLLSNLRAATRGTVTDIDLMKASVQAQNFQIPLENLADYFDFARQRARDTGESVDYLVQSIITGIGRKSPLILDNLGISAVRLRESIGEVGTEAASVGDVAQAVGNIIREENAKTGASTDGVTDQIVKNEAAWKNIRTEIAERFLPVIAFLGSALLAFSGILSGIPFTVVTVALSALTVAVIANQVAVSAATKGTIANTAALIIQNIWTKAVTAATWLWTAALKVTPLGWFWGLLTAVTAAMVLLTKNTYAAIAATSENTKVNEEAGKVYARQMVNIDAWMRTVQSAKATVDQKRAALRQLIAVDPAFRKVLKDQKVEIDKVGDAFFNSAETAKLLAAAYKEVANAAWIKARAEASASLFAQTERELSALAELQQKVETQAKKGGTKDRFGLVEIRIDKGDMSAEELKIIDKFINTDKKKGVVTGWQAGGDFVITTSAGEKIDFTKGLAVLDAVRDEIQKKYAERMEISDKAAADLRQSSEKRQKENAALFEVDIAGWKAESKALGDQIDEFKGQQADLNQLIEKKKAIDKKISDATGSGSNKRSSSRLSGATKDQLKEIETATALQMVEMEKRNLQGELTEVEYYSEIDRITQEGISRKLEIIASGNAEELKQRADLELASVKSTKDLNKRLFDLEEKAINDRFNEVRREADNRLKATLDNVNSTEVQKLQAQVEYDNTMINALIQFNSEMDQLEKDRNLKSKDNAQQRNDEAREQNRKRLNDEIALNRAISEEIRKATDQEINRSLNNEDAAFFKAQKEIFNTRYISKAAQNKALEDLEAEHQAKVLGIQLAGLKAQQNNLVQQFLGGIISWEEYQEELSRINAEIAENQADTAELTLEGLEKALESFKVFLLTLGSVLEAANQAIFQPLMDLYSQRIDNEQKLTEEQLKQEEERKTNQASSQEERNRIEKEYDQKRAESAKKYGEQRRQMALKELAIESAVAAIKAYSTAATIYDGIFLAGLVGVQYLIQRQKIMEQKFEKGGGLKKTLNAGGVFDGPSHSGGGIKFLFGGAPKEVEGKEGYVINKKSMGSSRKMTVTGTPGQIASAANVAGGGIDFNPGAYVNRFEYGGRLGSNTLAPVFVPNFYSSSSRSGNDLQSFKEMSLATMQAVVAVSNKVEKLQVVLDPNNVTNYQTKQAKSVQIATL